MIPTGPVRFGEAHFGAANLGHKDRTDCLIRIANLIHRHPGDTLPHKLRSPKDYKAMDRLVNRPEVTHAAVLRPHRQRTLARMRHTPGVVLVLHDTTELDYSGLSIPEFGPIGSGYHRGYLCHNSLAVAFEQREVLGLVSQVLHVRVPVPKNETVKAKRERESRESRLWTQTVRDLEVAPTDRLWIDIADRGADVFEFLAYEVTAGRRFVVRSSSDRSIRLGHGNDSKQLLHAHMRSLPLHGRKRITVGGRGKTPERKATVAVSFAKVQVQEPVHRRGEYERRPLDLWCVRVTEINPPEGVTPVEWILLTNQPVTTLVDAWERVSWYEVRWVVEEYHKAMKTGCAIQEMQFTTAQALEPMIALLSVVAVTLLNLREAARRPDATERLATDLVDAEYVSVLSAWRHKEIRMAWTVHDFFYALARLGGHQNRKSDHRPGWLVLWRGWTALQHMVDGAAAAKLSFCG
jgi:hypothetical protein